MDTDDLYPTELELIYSSLTVLMCEEKDVEKRIAVNNDDIKNRVKDIVIPMYDVSACPTSDVEHQHQHQHQHQNFERETTSDPEPSAQHTLHQDSEQTSTSESSPIVKKLLNKLPCYVILIKSKTRNMAVSSYMPVAHTIRMMFLCFSLFYHGVPQ